MTVGVIYMLVVFGMAAFGQDTGMTLALSEQRPSLAAHGSPLDFA